jgi:hypothetical protein
MRQEQEVLANQYLTPRVRKCEVCKVDVEDSRYHPYYCSWQCMITDPHQNHCLLCDVKIGRWNTFGFCSWNCFQMRNAPKYDEEYNLARKRSKL